MKPSRPFIQSQYVSSVFTSAKGSACAVKVAFGWQYALQPSQPLPVSHASKNFIATSLIDISVSSSRWIWIHGRNAGTASAEFFHPRLRLLQPVAHVHLAEHCRRGSEVLA